MDELYHNKYRVPSARASWHDYDGGAYFITICTAMHAHYFGDISDGKIHLSAIGKYAEECIGKMETLHDDISVPVYQVMPNHIHLIVIVHGDVETPYYDVCTNEMPYYDVCTKETPYYDVSTAAGNKGMRKIALRCGRLSHIISRFKSAVTKYARNNGITFGWQTRFYDHIIRNADEMNCIAAYIVNNVARWETDQLNNPTATDTPK